MPRSLRAVAFVAGVCVLYVLGYVAMTVTKPPWGLLWLPPLAVLAGAAWTALEWADARAARHAREREREREHDRHRAGERGARDVATPITEQRPAADADKAISQEAQP
jgi:hypothetical protein